MSLPPPPPRPRSPARPVHRGIWIGAAMLVVAVLFTGGWFITRFPAVSDEIDRLHRAGPEAAVEFSVDEPVDWDIYLEPSVASRSGFRFRIVDDAGVSVRLGNDHGFAYEWFGRSGRSIASVVLAPGTYRMEVIEGTATVAAGPSPAGTMAWAIGGGLIGGGVLGLAGVVVMIVSAVRDTRRRNERNEPPPPSPWSAGEWPADGGR